MAVRSATVVVKNLTRETSLVLYSASLAHGEWDVSPSTAELVPGMLTAWTSQSDGFATGTQGVANFSLHFNDPQKLQVWSLQKELAILAKFLPIGFSAVNGIRSLFPTGFTGTIKAFGLFFDGKYNGQQVTFNWDNPYWGSNSFSGAAPPPFTISQQGGIGDNAVAVITIAD